MHEKHTIRSAVMDEQNELRSQREGGKMKNKRARGNKTSALKRRKTTHRIFPPTPPHPRVLNLNHKHLTVHFFPSSRQWVSKIVFENLNVPREFSEITRFLLSLTIIFFFFFASLLSQPARRMFNIAFPSILAS